MLRDGLREDAMAKCAEQGLRYLENNAKARERVIVSSGEIEYMCVGPDHPRYAEAIDPNL
ncbi:MAG: hypothetical protein V2J51_01075 [Erythrobacter sp.]|nr:hypothetical protein [Erythrobacter sp.]